MRYGAEGRLPPSRAQEDAVAELEEEMERVMQAVAEAEARAAATEAAAATAKDQLVRLTADFENFRRRSVRMPPGTAHADTDCKHFLALRVPTRSASPAHACTLSSDDRSRPRAPAPLPPLQPVCPCALLRPPSS
eukprot:365996-Chlamydomonas_euryale.AAC.1